MGKRRPREQDLSELLGNWWPSPGLGTSGSYFCPLSPALQLTVPFCYQADIHRNPQVPMVFTTFFTTLFCFVEHLRYSILCLELFFLKKNIISFNYLKNSVK